MVFLSLTVTPSTLLTQILFFLTGHALWLKVLKYQVKCKLQLIISWHKILILSISLSILQHIFTIIINIISNYALIQYLKLCGNKKLLCLRDINKLYGDLYHSTGNDSSSTQNFYQTPNEVFSGSAALVRKTFCVSC